MKSSNLFFNCVARASGLVFTILLSVQNIQAQDAAEGATLFQKNCKSCHAIDRKMTGPALKGVSERHDEAWLLKWIKNAPARIGSGDAAAVKLFEENNKMMMPPQPMLTEGNILSILAYIKSEETKAAAPAAPAAGAAADGSAVAATDGAAAGPVSDFMLLGLLVVIVIAFLIIGVLNRIIGTLERMLAKKRGTLPGPGSDAGHDAH